MPPRLSCALVALSLAVAPAARAATASEAAVLVEQGQKYERDGKPDVALELYRAALLLDPNDAGAHRLAGELLRTKERCAEAVPEFRSFLQLAPPAARQGPEWDDAVVHLAACLRAEQAHVEVRPTADGRCGIDGGPAREAVQARPLVFDVAPGEHTIQCFRGEQQAAPLVVSVAGRETRSVVADLAALANLPVIQPDPNAAAKDPVGDAPLLPPPDAPPPPPPAPAPPPAPLVANAASVRVQLDGAGWSCSVDQGAPLTPDANQVVLVDVSPGEHLVRCQKPGLRPFEQRVALVRGERAELRPAGKPDQVAPGAPGQPGEVAARNDALEWGFQGGFGAGLGTFGIGVSARMNHWALQVGSGLYPFALSTTYFARPGATGLYVNAGYMRVAEGLFAGGSTVPGHGLFASAGLDVHADRNLAVRVGMGMGYNSTGLSSGPFTFDLSAVYVP